MLEDSGLKTVYIKDTFFNQSKLKREVELQNKRFVHFKAHRDVMQVSTIRPQLGLRSELVDGYR